MNENQKDFNTNEREQAIDPTLAAEAIHESPEAPTEAPAEPKAGNVEAIHESPTSDAPAADALAENAAETVGVIHESPESPTESPTEAPAEPNTGNVGAIQESPAGHS